MFVIKIGAKSHVREGGRSQCKGTVLWREAVVGVQEHCTGTRELAVGPQFLLPVSFGFGVYVLIGHFTFEREFES